MTLKVVLKLGGSLITEKNKPYTPRLDIIDMLSTEITEALANGARIIIVHGGGSFGHVEAHKALEKYGKLTNESLPKITNAMNQLNQIIMKSLLEKNVPAVNYPPHTFCTWKCSVEPGLFVCDYRWLLNSFLKGNTPVSFGDIVYGESECDPAILSGDNIALETGLLINADKIVFAMDVKGIYKDIDDPATLYENIILENIPEIIKEMSRKTEERIDVTEGIKGKLNKIHSYLKEKTRRPEIIMVSGLEKNNVLKALLGQPVDGTRII